MQCIRRHWPVPALFAVWIMMIVTIRPYGEFPYNDDWAFSLPVKWLLETGQLHLTFWAEMTLVSHVMLGAAWAALIGFSLQHLRFLVISLVFLFLGASYGLLREAGVTRPISFFVVLSFLSFPVFPVIAMSFMTDVPFLAFGVTSLLFLLMVINGSRTWVVSYIAGAVFLIAAILVRQVGIGIAIAFALGDLLTNGIRVKVLLRAGGLFALSIAIVTAYPILMGTALPPQYHDKIENMMLLIRSLLSLHLGAAKPLVHGILAGCLYTGLLATPLTFGLFFSRMTARKLSRATIIITVLVGTLLFGTTAVLNTPIPTLASLGSVLTFAGVGPRYTGDYASADPGASIAVWWSLTVISSISIAFLFSEITIGLAHRKRHIIRTQLQLGTLAFFAAAAVGSYLPYCLNYGPWFDRYILFSAVPFLALVATIASKWEIDVRRAVPLFVASFAICLTMTTLLTRDFFTWTRAKWSVIDKGIVDLEIAPNKLDGGFEYDNYVLFKGSSLEALPRELAAVNDRDFRVATRRLPEYDVLAATKVNQIVPMGNNMIFLLKKATR